ncbi:MAG TPA: hypothetical protein VGB76_14805 [Pyrinomonadaceae bacterium]|jgi:hypothetical protein
MFSMQTSNAGDRATQVSFDDAGNAESVGDDGGDATLEDVAEREHEYLRTRLREELQREPTEEELDEWLRKHTEGH